MCARNNALSRALHVMNLRQVFMLHRIAHRSTRSLLVLRTWKYASLNWRSVWYLLHLNFSILFQSNDFPTLESAYCCTQSSHPRFVCGGWEDGDDIEAIGMSWRVEAQSENNGMTINRRSTPIPARAIQFKHIHQHRINSTSTLYTGTPFKLAAGRLTLSCCCFENENSSLDWKTWHCCLNFFQFVVILFSTFFLI